MQNNLHCLIEVPLRGVLLFNIKLPDLTIGVSSPCCFASLYHTVQDWSSTEWCWASVESDSTVFAKFE